MRTYFDPSFIVALYLPESRTGSLRSWIESQNEAIGLNEWQDLEFRNAARQKVMRGEATEGQIAKTFRIFDDDCRSTVHGCSRADSSQSRRSFAKTEADGEGGRGCKRTGSEFLTTEGMEYTETTYPWIGSENVTARNPDSLIIGPTPSRPRHDRPRQQSARFA